MTDTTEPTAETPSAPSPAEETTPETPGEAAKYRKRLRETEGERDRLAGELDAARVSIVRQAAEHTRGFDMTAFEVAGFDLPALFDETGAFDREAFAAQVDTLRTEKPYVFDRGPIIPGQGKTPSSPGRLNNWQSAFAPTRD